MANKMQNIIGAGENGASCAGENQYPAILDACCGGRMFWFDKHNPNVLFADRRVMKPEIVGSGKDARVRKCLPDVVMDFREMNIPSFTFQLVVFDPPHLFLGENSYMAKNYGSLNKQTWRKDIRKGFSECFRVLKVGGILIFKWNECDILLSEVLKCTDEKPLFGHPSGKSQKTHWLCFMKEESPVLCEENPAQEIVEICHTSPNTQSPK